MSPRYFAKAYRNERYKNHHYHETREAKMEDKLESMWNYFWRKLWRKK